VLVGLHGTNWASDGFWSPGGEYVYVVVIAALVWTVVTSVLLFRAPITTDLTAPTPAA
jgi:hypothetical protein